MLTIHYMKHSFKDGLHIINSKLGKESILHVCLLVKYHTETLLAENILTHGTLLHFGTF